MSHPINPAHLRAAKLDADRMMAQAFGGPHSTTDTKTVHRHEIPIDGQPHQITLAGNIVHVDARKEGYIELWSLTGDRPWQCTLQVFGTGHDIPANALYRGTALSPQIGAEPFAVPRGRYVWHLFQVYA